MPEPTLRRLARWKTDCIERYIASVPLEDLGPEVLFGQGANENLEVKKILAEVRSALARNAAAASVHQWPDMDTTVIINKYPGKEHKVHRIKTWMGLNSEWCSGCGWRFGEPMAKAETVPWGTACRLRLALCSGGCFSKSFIKHHEAFRSATAEVAATVGLKVAEEG